MMPGFVPRKRGPMEALDLGLGLLQAHWRPVAALWALQTGLGLALLLPFLWRTPLACLLGLWWLKPWLDRGVLFALSRAVFGQPATLWDFLREWRAVHRKGVAAGLLWRRFAPARSFVLPVFQLEGLGGAAYRERARVLARQGGGTGFLLTVSCWIFSLLTFGGALGLLQAMLPADSGLMGWRMFQNAPPGYQWLLLALGVLTLTLTEPFFVAAGFGLYLNRRTQLEGWDLELAFRRLAARLALVLILAVSAWAQEPAPLPRSGPLRPEAEALIRARRVLDQDPAFRRTREVRKLQYQPTGREPRWLRTLLDALFDRDSAPKPEEKPNPYPEWLARMLALGGKVVLVGGLLVLALWLAYRLRKRLGGPAVTEEAWHAPEALAGLDIRPESLPPHLPSAARRLHARGEVRAALSLLYRGALAELVHSRGLELPASATEGDCLRAAEASLEPASAQAMGTLTRAWQRLAYKDEAPGDEAFEALCQDWPLACGGAP